MVSKIYGRSDEKSLPVPVRVLTPLTDRLHEHRFIETVLLRRPWIRVASKLLSVAPQLLRLVHGRFSHVSELQILDHALSRNERRIAAFALAVLAACWNVASRRRAAGSEIHPRNRQRRNLRGAVPRAMPHQRLDAAVPPSGQLH
jgi:hypothetical protein